MPGIGLAFLPDALTSDYKGCMQLNCGFVVSSALIFFLSFPVYAHDINPAFEELKQSSEKYEIAGTVCEQVARLELEQQYPADQYSVQNGIAYTQHGQILGELDVVVFRKSDHKVILIGEVKCWHNLEKARKKAVVQRERFRFYLHNGGYGIDFYRTAQPRVHFKPVQFENAPPFILISQEEGSNIGFDLALPYTLNELMQLRDLLVHCQYVGECSKPL
jgi:hypothetical protein